MEEVKITFETAKLAKEKGFNWESSFLYDEKCNLGINHHDYKRMFTNNKEDTYNIAAPTQSLLQKWLREVHNIHFEIKPIFDVKDNLKPYHISVIKNPSGKDFEYKIVGTFNTYEEVLEVGLQEGLKLISNEL